MKLKDLGSQSQERPATAKTQEGAFENVEDEAMGLSDDQLDGIAGGRKVAARAGHTRKGNRFDTVTSDE